MMRLDPMMCSVDQNADIPFESRARPMEHDAQGSGYKNVSSRRQYIDCHGQSLRIY